MSSRSSSASSFERIDSSDNEKIAETSFVSASEASEASSEDHEQESVRSGSPSSEFDEVEHEEVVDEVAKAELEKKELLEKLAALELRCEQQCQQIILMADENKALSMDAKSDAEALKTAIEGKWKFASSTDLNVFIQRRRTVATPTDLDDVILHVAEQNIRFADDTVELFESVGPMEFNKKRVPLAQTIFIDGCAESTFIAGGVMKTRRIQMGGLEKCFEEERFVKKGKLHVVTRMHGETITRVYADRKHVTDICGHWRQIGKSDRSISLNLKNGQFYRKTMNDDKKDKDSAEQFRMDVMDRGWMTSVEGAVLVQKQYAEDGSVSMVRKRFVVNGELVSLQEQPGKSVERWTFERVGAPLTP